MSGQVLLSKASAIVDMNGTTDYLEGYTQSNFTSVIGTASWTNFSAVLLAPQGGGSGGGTGVSAMSSLTDVQLSNLSGRDYLRYDTDKDGYVVPIDVDKRKLENAPRYREEAVPVYDTDFGKRIDSYYGPDA